VSGRSPAVRHLVLAALALAWIGAVVQSITYRDALWFRYYVINLVWLQYLFLVLAIFGGVILLLGVVRRRPSPGRWPRLPLVSIIIPAKDEIRVIEGAVRSACGQDYPGGVEVIVVDDHSTDGTSEALARLAAALPLTVVQTRPGSIGKAAALQVGVAHSRGELIAVFDADARLEPGVLARMVPHLADPHVGAAQGRRLVHNGGRNRLTRIQEDEYRVFQTLLQRARQAVGAFVCLAGNGLIVKRAALEAVGSAQEQLHDRDSQRCEPGDDGQIGEGLRPEPVGLCPFPGPEDVPLHEIDQEPHVPSDNLAQDIDGPRPPLFRSSPAALAGTAARFLRPQQCQHEVEAVGDGGRHEQPSQAPHDGSRVAGPLEDLRGVNHRHDAAGED